MVFHNKTGTMASRKGPKVKEKPNLGGNKKGKKKSMKEVNETTPKPSGKSIVFTFDDCGDDVSVKTPTTDRRRVGTTVGAAPLQQSESEYETPSSGSPQSSGDSDFKSPVKKKRKTRKSVNNKRDVRSKKVLFPDLHEKKASSAKSTETGLRTDDPARTKEKCVVDDYEDIEEEELEDVFSDDSEFESDSSEWFDTSDTENETDLTTDDSSTSNPRGVEEEYQDNEEDDVAVDKASKPSIKVPSIKGVNVELKKIEGIWWAFVDLMKIAINPHYQLLLDIEQRTASMSEEEMSNYVDSCTRMGVKPSKLLWKTVRANKPYPERTIYVIEEGSRGSHQLITTYVKKNVKAVLLKYNILQKQRWRADPENKQKENDKQRQYDAQDEVKDKKAIRKKELKKYVVYQTICVPEDKIRNMSANSVLKKLMAGQIEKYSIYTGEYACHNTEICYRKGHATKPFSPIRKLAVTGHRIFQYGLLECATKAEAELMESLVIINEQTAAEKYRKTKVINGVPGVLLRSHQIIKTNRLGKEGKRLFSFKDPLPKEKRTSPHDLQFPFVDKHFKEITEDLRKTNENIQERLRKKKQNKTPSPATTTPTDGYVYVAVAVKAKDIPTNILPQELKELIASGCIPVHVYAGLHGGECKKGIRPGHFNDKNSVLHKLWKEGSRVYFVKSFRCKSYKEAQDLEVTLIGVIHEYASTNPNTFCLNTKWGSCLPHTKAFMEAASIDCEGPDLFQWCEDFQPSRDISLPWSAILNDITHKFRIKEEENPPKANASKPRHTSTKLQQQSTSKINKKPASNLITSSKAPELHPVPRSEGFGTGLINLNNTCYLNSIVQCLFHLPGIVDYFSSDQWRSDYTIYRDARNPNRGQVSPPFHALMKAMKLGTGPIAPTDIKTLMHRNHPSFKGNGQQDSHEFLTHLLDDLHKELNQGSNLSRITDLFSGQQKSVVKCLSCHNKSETLEPFKHLSVPLPLTGPGLTSRKVDIHDCMNLYTNEESLSGWICPHCKSRVNATKKIELIRLPHNLIIHMKRFTNDGWKKETEVDFPVDLLDLTEYLKGPGPSQDIPVSRTSFTLQAVSNHYGNMNSGHYTAYCRRQGEFFKFNDQEVSRMNMRAVVTPAAYLLFYQKKIEPSSRHDLLSLH